MASGRRVRFAVGDGATDFCGDLLVQVGWVVAVDVTASNVPVTLAH